MDAYGDQWVHKLPRVRTVTRNDHIVERSVGKRVVHVGFWGTDGSRERHQANGTWLHARIDGVARELVGLDHNESGIARAREQGYEAHAADVRDVAAVAAVGVEPAELVVAGEIIEHLERPGDFLDAMHSLVAPGGQLLLTTPNAYRLSNAITGFTGRELMNPDHIAIYSWFTLTNLLSRHGWDVDWFHTYNRAPRKRKVARAGDKVTEVLARRFPFVAAGLIVGCRSVD